MFDNKMYWNMCCGSFCQTENIDRPALAVTSIFIQSNSNPNAG